MQQMPFRNECLICFKPIYLNADVWAILGLDNICGDCRKGFKKVYRGYSFLGRYYFPLYHFDEDVSKVIIRYKDFKDIALAPLFLKRFKYFMKKILKDYCIVPIPSDLKKETERGFNHLRLILNDCELEICECLIKESEGLQRFKTFKQREEIKFRLINKNTIKDRKVVLFDDVLTSGNSFKEALRVIAPHARRVIFISIFVNKRFIAERGFKNDWKSKVV